MPSSYAPLDVEQLLVTLPLADKIKLLAGNGQSAQPSGPYRD